MTLEEATSTTSRGRSCANVPMEAFTTQGTSTMCPVPLRPRIRPITTVSSAMNLPDLSVQLYNPSFDKDRFENTALTINGRIGALNFVYSGAYLVRTVDQIQDYTNYARGTYADYYQCLRRRKQESQVSAIRRAPHGMIMSGTCIKAMRCE